MAITFGLVGFGAIDAPVVHAASAADGVAACRAAAGSVPQIGERACRTVEQFLRGAGNGCRTAGLADTCAVADGREAGAAHIAAFTKSWTHRALTLQRALDDDVPFARSTMVHTHNSFNSAVYSPPTLTNQDPNQIYSMADQMTMDVRAIEMDVHWVASAYGTAKTGYKAVTLCHGNVNSGVHVGCSIDRPLAYGLAELRSWLIRPENRREVVLLYLENNLDDDLTAHNQVGAALQRGLGDLVARPPANQPCAPLPTSTTPATLRAAGHRVIIVGNCGPGAWGSWVFERGNAGNWQESGSGPGDDYPGLKGCGAERKRTAAGRAIVRWYEDSTWLTATVDGDSPHLTATEAAAMAKCGATLIGFDQLTPEDPRLAAVVWSWARDEPAVSGDARCAASMADTHFHAQPCAATHAFACSAGPDGWKVSVSEGAWSAGQATCAHEFPGSTFAVPANGWENSLMRAAAGTRAVWLHYADRVGHGGWSA
jgi:hypothetical protein